MSQILPTQILKESRLKGYRPRIGIEFRGLKKFFSAAKEFTAEDLEDGNDGVSGAGTGTFTSASATFQTNGITSADSLVIGSGADAGTYDITSVDSEIQLTVDATFSGDTGANYSIHRTYTDEIYSKPSVIQKTEQLGGVSTVGGIGVSILNQELFSDLFVEGGSYPDPENEECYAHLFFDDGTDILYAEKVQFFKGLVADFPKITYDDVNFQIDSNDAIKHKTIGELITTADAPSGYGMPDDSLGKMKPIIYGNHRFYIHANIGNNLIATRWQSGRKNNVTPMVHIGSNQWIVSAHQILTPSTGDTVWIKDPNLNRLVEVKDWTVVQNNASGCIISIDSTTFYDYRRPTGLSTPTNDPWHAPSRIHDGAVSLAAQAGLYDTDPILHMHEMLINFPSNDIDAGSINGLRIFALIKWEVPPNPAEVSCFIQGGGEYDDNTETEYFQNHNNASPAGVIEQLSLIFKKMIAANNWAGNNYFAGCYEVYMRVSYEMTDTVKEAYWGGRGRLYGTWINGRSTLETDPEGNNYTENHVDDDGANDLITNPAGVLESLLVDELNLANTEIKENSFNICSNDLSTVHLSYAITEQIKSISLMDDICKKVKSSFHFNYNNLAKMTTFVPGDPFSASGDSVSSNQDIYEFDPQSTFKIVSGENDKIDFDEGAGELTATLTAAEYTGSSLVAEIQTQMNSAGATYTVTYSASTGKFTITKSAGTYKFLWSSGTNISTSTGRFIGFDISSDTGLTNSKTSDYPLWINSFVENPIIKKSFKIKKAADKVITDYIVNYWKNYISDTYHSKATATDNTYHSETITDEFYYPYTRTVASAELYRDFLVDRKNRKHYECTFKTWLNAIHIELWDIINVRHPVLENLVSNYKTKKWLLTGYKLKFNSMEVEITAVEI